MKIPKCNPREIAIDGAALALMRLRYPRATTCELMKRSSWEAVKGSGSYTFLFDGKPFARIDLEGPKSFTLTVL